MILIIKKKKIFFFVPSSIQKLLSPMGLAYWIMDDGSLTRFAHPPPTKIKDYI